jgi:hypothetical protein
LASKSGQGNLPQNIANVPKHCAHITLFKYLRIKPEDFLSYKSAPPW